MADIRWKDKPNKSNPADNDIVVGTEASSGNDVHYIFTDIATKIKALILDATASVRGLMSAADKSKLDGIASGATANTGDMTKGAYDGNDDGKVDSADLADQASELVGAPNPNQFWATDSGGTQQWRNINSEDLLNIQLWQGTTSDDTETEIFINGQASNRLEIPANTLYSLDIAISAAKGDFTTGGYFRSMLQITRDGFNNTQLVGTVNTIGADINPENLNVSISADDTLEALTIKVTGKAGENWYWDAQARLIERTV